MCVETIRSFKQGEKCNGLGKISYIPYACSVKHDLPHIRASPGGARDDAWWTNIGKRRPISNRRPRGIWSYVGTRGKSPIVIHGAGGDAAAHGG